MARAVFTYGTLMFSSVLEAVTGRSFASMRGRVHGFERFAVLGEVFPALLETGRRSTAGRVYFGVDDETLACLDRFEDWLYERRPVEVGLLDGRRQRAEAWIVPDRHASLLGDGPWDEGRFLRRDLQRYRRSCRAFRAQDRRESAARAADEARRGSPRQAAGSGSSAATTGRERS